MYGCLVVKVIPVECLCLASLNLISTTCNVVANQLLFFGELVLFRLVAKLHKSYIFNLCNANVC